jgi:hypothetical protein
MRGNARGGNRGADRGQRGPPEAASAASGAAGKSPVSSPQKWKQSDSSDGDFIFRKEKTEKSHKANVKEK